MITLRQVKDSSIVSTVYEVYLDGVRIGIVEGAPKSADTVTKWWYPMGQMVRLLAYPTRIDAVNALARAYREKVAYEAAQAE